MKTLIFKTREAWLKARRGKITGTRLGEISLKRDGSKKIGFYELVAERLAEAPTDENPADRGNRLQDEATKLFMKKTGHVVDSSLKIWVRDDAKNIGISPDGSMYEDTVALEIKCLSSARHIEAFLTETIPDDFKEQVLQYFIVNEKLEKLYFCFYDPRFKKDSLQCFFRIVERKDINHRVQEMLTFEKQTLKEVSAIVHKLSSLS